jgi:hypothetical protein
MNYVLVLISSLCLLGCCSPGSITSYCLVPYEESNYNFFEDGRGPTLEEFNKTLKNAINNNDRDLSNILSWASLTSNGGTLAYGEFLLKLQNVVGEKRIIHCIDSLPKENQENIRYTLLTTYHLKKFVSKL